MAWTDSLHWLRRLPLLVGAGRLEFDFDGLPLRARGLSWRQRSNLLKVGVAEALGCTRMPGRPPALQIEPTNLCDLSCPLCPTGSSSCGRPAGSMALDTFDRIMAEVGDTLVFALLYGWGEPFLNPHLSQMIAKCTEHGIVTTTSTNGQHLQTVQEARAVVDAGLDGLVIALDGITQETYERYRRGGDVEKVKHCARMVEQAKREAGSERPYTSIRVVVTKRNEHEVEAIRQFAVEIGANMYSSKSVGVLWAMGQTNDFEPDTPELRRSGADADERSPEALVKCHYPFRQPTIYWDGVVVGCEYDYGFETAWGDINEQGFEEIWNSPQAQQLRAAILGHTERPKFCDNCPYTSRTGDTCVIETEELR
jgi:radical SAM protein with 4Fe4S-binding SPASM domain